MLQIAAQILQLFADCTTDELSAWSFVSNQQKIVLSGFQTIGSWFGLPALPDMKLINQFLAQESCVVENACISWEMNISWCTRRIQDQGPGIV